jgi:vWA-MoxR associated protein C-terminal domain/vWA-MoxR associated protein middle region (VMAP-M) 1
MIWEGSVSELYQTKLKKLEADKRRLEALTADYDAVTKQFEIADPTVIPRLERGEEAKYEAMETLAKQIDAQERELVVFQQQEQLEALPQALQELINILLSVNFDVIRIAYSACIEGRSREVPSSLVAVIAQLADIPGNLDELKSILRFVSILIQNQALEESQRNALRNWGQAQGLPSIVSNSALVTSGIVENYLMVKVKPRSLNDASLGYLVTAAIVQDSEPFKAKTELIEKSLPVPPGSHPKYAPGYSQAELPQVLSELITICGGKLHKIPLTNLTVQWFLPIELLSWPVEHWQIKIGKKMRCSGARCKTVIIRSYDRHFSNDYETVLGEWESAWKRFLDNPTSHCHQALHPLDCLTKETVIEKNDIVGGHFVEHPEQQQQEDFWDDLLGQGLPIVLWSRQVGANPQCVGDLMASVRDCLLAKLPESLANQRRTALSSAAEPDRMEAAPIALLWDNPFRPFPTIDYPST